MSTRHIVPIALLLLLVLGSGTACRTLHRQPRQVQAVFEQVQRAAQARLAEGELVAARRLARAAHRLRPDLPLLREAVAACPPEIDVLFESPGLGVNMARRAPVDRPFWQDALLYLPDRVLDLFDVVSFDVAFGYGLFANVHVTRAVQMGAGGRAALGVGWHEQRSLGIQLQIESGAAFLGLGESVAYAFTRGTASTLGGGRPTGLHRPGDPVYQDLRDYWALGAGVHALLLGVDVDVHPLELADFVAGLLTFDFLNDDLSSGASEPLAEAEFGNLKILNEILVDERTVRDYHAWIAAGGLEAHEGER